MEPTQQKEETTNTVRTSPRLWIGYVVPMVAYALLTYVEGMFPSSWYAGLYAVKVGVVAVLLVICRRVWRDIRFEARVLPIAILVGVAVFFEWIVVDRFTPHFGFLGSRPGFDPRSIHESVLRSSFVAVRLFGLAVVVPIMEELFWRSFLLRWLTDPDFANIPMGTFSWGAFAIVSTVFGIAHPEWLAAIICAAAYGLLLKYTKSLFACIVAHATTNLVLGIYILLYQKWFLW